MSTDVATRDERTPAQILVAQVRTDQFKQQVALALPEDVRPERFVRAVVTALQSTPDLLDADHDSLFTSALRAAQDGLLPDGREAAFVTFNSKVKEPGGGERWVKKVQYMPMVGGLRKIAAEHGWTISAHVVYENDEFHHELGVHERLIHVPVRPGQARGGRVAVYAVGKHRDGRDPVFEVLFPEDVEKVRQVSRAKDSGPWRDWPERMWEKTAARALFKKLALDPNDRRVASMLTDGVTDPASAVYGHRPVVGELPPVERPVLEAPRDTVGQGTGGTAPGVEAGDGQQAAAGEETAAVPDPDPDPEPVVAQPAPAPAPEPEPEPAAAMKKPSVAQARKVVLPHGVNKGLTLGDVAAADGAVTYFGWALRNLGSFDAEVAAAIRVVAEKDVPDAWAAHTEKHGS